MPLAIAPENGVAAAQHYVVRSRASHERLMKIVAHRVLVGEALQEGDITILHVVEGHRIAPAIVIHLVGNGKAGGIDFAGIRGDDEGIQVLQATGRILPRGIPASAIRLLPHLEEAVRSVSVIGVVGQIGSRQRERRKIPCPSQPLKSIYSTGETKTT